MSAINSSVVMLFGGTGDAGFRASANKNNQGKAESLAAVTRRVCKGPKRNGGMSIMFICDSSSGVTSATGFSVWYSNLPEPDATADTDWVQDTTIGIALALTATGKTLLSLAGRQAEWVMVKADVTAGTAGVRVFARSEGVEV